MNINTEIEKVYESSESLRDKAKDLRIETETIKDLLNRKLKNMKKVV